MRKGRPLLVAVKILRPDASKNARYARLSVIATNFAAILKYFSPALSCDG